MWGENRKCGLCVPRVADVIPTDDGTLILSGSFEVENALVSASALVLKKNLSPVGFPSFMIRPSTSQALAPFL